MAIIAKHTDSDSCEVFPTISIRLDKMEAKLDKLEAQISAISESSKPVTAECINKPVYRISLSSDILAHIIMRRILRIL